VVYHSLVVLASSSQSVLMAEGNLASTLPNLINYTGHTGAKCLASHLSASNMIGNSVELCNRVERCNRGTLCQQNQRDNRLLVHTHL
jgi:hypothetical protein